VIEGRGKAIQDDAKVSPKLGYEACDGCVMELKVRILKAYIKQSVV